MTKFIVNPVTGEYESTAYTFRDRFDLKDQVADASDAVQGTEDAIGLSLDAFKAYQNAGGTKSYKNFIKSGNEGVSKFFKDGGSVETPKRGLVDGPGSYAGFVALPFISPGMVPAIASLLGVTATGQAISTYLQNNPKAIDTVKKALKMSGKVTGVLPFGTKPGEQPDVEEELKELTKPRGFPDKAPEMPKSEGIKIPEQKKPDAPINKPPETKPLKGFPDQSEEIDTSILYNAPTSEDEMSIIRNQFGTYKIKKSEDKRNIKTKVPEPEDGITFSDFRTKLTKEPNLLKDIAKKYDKNKFYNTKDLFNIFGVTTKKGNPTANEYFTGELKRSEVNSRLISSGGRGQEYKLKDVINFFKENPKTTGLGRTKSEIVDARNKAEDRLDKDLYDFNKRVIKNIRETSQVEGVYLPTSTLGASPGDHIGHPVSVKITDKKEFKKLLKNSNINRINSLVFQDAEINMKALNTETGYDMKFNTYFKQLNKFLDKPVTKEDQKQLSIIKKDMNSHYNKLINKINEKSAKNKFFVGQEKRVPKVTINIPKVGSKFKSSDLFADMSTVDANYRYGKIQEINSDAIKFKDLSKEEKEIFTQNIYNQYSDNLNTFYKDAGIPKEDVEDFSEFIETGGVKEMIGKKNIISKEYMAEGGRITGSIDVPKIDGQFMAAEGGRVNFGEGSPDPDFINMAIAADQNNNIPIEDKTFLGIKLADNPLQRFNEMIDPRAYPYYGQKIVEGAANIPEYAVRTLPALGQLSGDLIKGRKSGKYDRFMEAISPTVTEGLKEKYGDYIGIGPESDKAAEKNRTGAQQQMGGQLEFLAEIPGPVTPFAFLLKTPKYFRQLRGLAGSTQAAKELERQIEEKIAVDQGRRDFNMMLGTGGVVALVKALGLDKFISVGSKVAQKTAPIVTQGGTPKYFFDFVSLIKKSGDDITEKASTLERQKVYDYNGYTMYEDLTSGEIRINKQSEGMSSGTDEFGEVQQYDTITGQEEIIYRPGEEILGKDGKAVKTLDEYEEATAKPVNPDGDMEGEAGLDSIEEILNLLRKDGKKYSKTELEDMGIDPDALGNYPTGAGSVRKETLLNPDIDTFTGKPKKAGGGIMKLAGDDSGTPPKSGPNSKGLNSEGLALILKRGRKY